MAKSLGLCATKLEVLHSDVPMLLVVSDFISELRFRQMGQHPVSEVPISYTMGGCEWISRICGRRDGNSVARVICPGYADTSILQWLQKLIKSTTFGEPDVKVLNCCELISWPVAYQPMTSDIPGQTWKLDQEHFIPSVPFIKFGKNNRLWIWCMWR